MLSATPRRSDDHTRPQQAPPPLTPVTHLSHLGYAVQQQFAPQQPYCNPAQDSYLFNSPVASSDMFSAFSRWSLAPQEHLLPYHYAGAIIPQEYGSSEVGFSPAPSDASLQSWDSDASPASAPAPPPHPTHVVCNAPLVAPVPLPYHSPTFLQYDDLPDDDEDLSHPPYTRRPHKRKRRLDEDEADSAAAGIQTMPAKRRSVSGPDNHPFAYRVPPDANAQALPLPMRALPVSIQTRHVRNARVR